MTKVTLSPEGQSSFKRLPIRVREGYDSIFTEIEGVGRLRLPGDYPCHQLEESRDLWTLKISVYRGIFRWDGNEARFIRFGHRATVFTRLPK